MSAVGGGGVAFPIGARLGFLGSVTYRRLLERYGFDPFLTMPPDGEFFDLFSTQAVAAAGGTATFASIRLSRNEYLRVSAMGLEADSASVVSISDMVFQLRINNIPHRFYGRISDQIGTGQDPTEIFARIFFPSSLVDFFATNNDALVGATSFGRIQGWSIPLT